MSDTYIEMATAGFGPSLREGEKIEMAGMAMVPPSGCLSLLFGNIMSAAQTYLTILTTQRLVLARTSSLAGKYTPKTIQVKREIELTEIRTAEIRKNRLVLDIGNGKLELVGVKALGLPLSPDFLPKLASYFVKPVSQP